MHQRLMALQAALNRQSGMQVSQIAKGLMVDIQEMATSLVAIGKHASDLSAETMGLRASILELQTKLSAMMESETRLKVAEVERDKMIAVIEQLRYQVQQSENEASREREQAKEYMEKISKMEEYMKVSFLFLTHETRRTSRADKRGS
jgi:hypothetical protein